MLKEASLLAIMGPAGLEIFLCYTSPFRSPPANRAVRMRFNRGGTNPNDQDKQIQETRHKEEEEEVSHLSLALLPGHHHRVVVQEHQAVGARLGEGVISGREGKNSP